MRVEVRTREGAFSEKFLISIVVLSILSPVKFEAKALNLELRAWRVYYVTPSLALYTTQRGLLLGSSGTIRGAVQFCVVCVCFRRTADTEETATKCSYTIAKTLWSDSGFGVGDLVLELPAGKQYYTLVLVYENAPVAFIRVQ